MSDSLWQYHEDIPNNNMPIPSQSNSGQTYRKNIYWNTLIIYGIDFLLTWLASWVITNSTGPGTFRIRKTKLYVSGVILSTQYSTKLQQKLNSGFKRTITWNKYWTNNPHLDQDHNLVTWLVQVSKESTKFLCDCWKIKQAEDGMKIITLQM